MEKNIFWLENDQLKEIASSFREKVEEGLKHENAEIQCIPTFISPKTSDINGKALVLDLGGTNYRVATVDLGQGSPTIHPNNGWKKDMAVDTAACPPVRAATLRASSLAPPTCPERRGTTNRPASSTLTTAGSENLSRTWGAMARTAIPAAPTNTRASARAQAQAVHPSREE